MSIVFTGGCLCGATRYESSVAPVLELNCHCRDCQRISGSGYFPVLFVPKDALTITGEVKYYDAKADSGRAISRGFCPSCGSQMFGKVELRPDLMAIRAGTLDDPSLFHPSADIYTDSAQHWDFMNPNLPKFPQMPPAPQS